VPDRRIYPRGLGHLGQTKAQCNGCAGNPGRRDDGPGNAELYPFRQRPEFIATTLRKWIADVGTRTADIEPGSPWENGYCESFNSKLRDELLNTEIFYSLREAEVLVEAWRRHFNTVRPHSALHYSPPAPEAILPATVGLRPGAPALEGARPAYPAVASNATIH